MTLFNVCTSAATRQWHATAAVSTSLSVNGASELLQGTERRFVAAVLLQQIVGPGGRIRRQPVAATRTGSCPWHLGSARQLEMGAMNARFMLRDPRVLLMAVAVNS
jgi:hypothetical protein